MYYKITDKQSEAWKTMQKVVDKIDSIKIENVNKIKQYVNFSRYRCKSNFCLDLTDFNSFEIIGKPPAGFMKDIAMKDTELNNFYKPDGRTKEGKKIKNILKEMKHYNWFQLADDLGYEVDQGNKLVQIGYNVMDDVILINTPEYMEWDGMPGMIEITRSEYKELSKTEKELAG